MQSRSAPSGPVDADGYTKAIFTLADLPPAVGGVRTFAPGGYLWTSRITLPDGERVTHQVGGNFVHKATVPGAGLQGSIDGNLFENAAGNDTKLIDFYADNLSNGGSAVGISNLATLNARGCVFRAQGGGTAIVQNGTVFRAWATQITSALRGIRHQVGDVLLTGVDMVSIGAGSGWASSTGTFGVFQWVGGLVGSSAQDVGRVQTNGEQITLIGVRGQNVTGGLLTRSAGTVGRVELEGCSLDNSAATGITWAAASAPTRGISIAGCDLPVAAPFSGFTSADARVNIRRCTNAAGLLTETAIV